MRKLLNGNSALIKCLAILMFVAGFSSIGHGATLTVTKTADTNDGVCDADCSLREAVAVAKTTFGDDIIEFSPDLALITLTSEIEIIVPSGSVTIIGRGADKLTIDGGPGNNRLFSLINATLGIQNVTLTGGNAGGENRSGFGGAIFSDGGNLVLFGVHVVGNTGTGGGVNISNGAARIINTTISGNSGGSCGGVNNSSGQMVIINSTISGNTATSQQGGGLCANGDTTLRNVTIADNIAPNAAGILKAATGTLNIGNTIVANVGFSEIQFNAGAIVSVGNNIIGDSPGEAANTGQWAPVIYHPTDILDTPPKLGRLRKNGTAIPTHSFALGSPALDGGNNSLAVDPANGSPLLTDQRGFSRLIDGDGNGTPQVDIGAFELRPLYVTNINDTGTGSLRQALLDVVSQADAIGFNSDLFNLTQTITLTGGELLIPPNTSFSINGRGSEKLTISGNNQSRVFNVSASAELLLDGLKIAGGRTLSGGGGIINYGTLTVSNSRIDGNTGNDGGGIFNNSGIVSVLNSSLNNNTANDGKGGGIFSFNNAKLTLTNSIVSNNQASNNGGGIDVYNADLALVSTSVTGNTAGSNGGGINLESNQGRNVSFNNSVISNNSAAVNGGGIQSAGSVSLSNTSIRSNSSDNDGGGIYIDSNSTVTLNRIIVSGNTARSNGGGIYNSNNLTIANSTLSGNSTSEGGAGGGLFNFGASALTNVTVSGNSAGGGGGIFNQSDLPLNLNSVTIAENTAAKSLGGGVFNGAVGIVNSRNSIFAGNRAAAGAPDFAFTLTSQGYNLIQNTQGTTIAGTTTGNILGQDPQLLPLNNYGGATPTHALRITSPAIDKGSIYFASGSDQRGLSRPYNNPLIPNAPGGDGSDIGAFERQTFDVAGSTSFDFDADGKADISVFRPENGSWYIQRSAAGFTGIAFGFGTDKLVPADYDGDGKTDVAVYRAGTWYIQRSSLGFYGAAFGDSNDIPVPADFDGDGKTELAVWRPSNGVWYVLNLATNQFTSAQFGASTDKPVASDYNGDGKADYAVFRPSNGFWYIARASGIPSQNFDSIQFGALQDKPVPADYDGDGKTDIAVFRPSNGSWYRLNSSNGQFAGTQFGISTDQPVPADYDGDGKADIAVFRSGVWYLNRSIAGFTGIQFGASTDEPVPNAFVQQ